MPLQVGDDHPTRVLVHVREPTALAPRALLDALLAIERRQGRVRRFQNSPRTLDLDVLLYGNLQLNEPDLVIPHPQLPHRDWWQRELAELGATQ